MTSGLLVSQFSTEDGWGSALIRYLSVSDFSHVDLVVPRDLIHAFAKFVRDPETRRSLEAWSDPEGLLGARFTGGVQLRPTNYAHFTRSVRMGCVVPDAPAGYAYGFAQIGKLYDKGAIVDFFLHRKRKFTFDAKAWFCNCLNYAIFWKAGKRLLNCDDPLGLTPQEEYLSPDLKEQMAASCEAV